jgi:hypothetical protein
MSDKTKREYKYSLKYFLQWLTNLDHIEDKDFAELLSTHLLHATNDILHMQNQIVDYIFYLRDERRLAKGLIKTFITAIQKYYVQNDVILNWRKIKSFRFDGNGGGSGNEDSGGRGKEADKPYTKEQIKLMLSKTTERAIILLMASAGLRVGALPDLRVGDLTPVDKYGLYQITVYAGDQNAKYTTFCSPECRAEIDGYLQSRKHNGEQITPNSYFIYCARV